MARTGRPKVVIDLHLVKQLAGIKCTIKEIGAVMDIPASTLSSRKDFSLVYKNGLENGKASLRRIQYRLAEKSAAMAIFLGKNYLDQKDVPLVDQSDRRNITLVWKTHGNGKAGNNHSRLFKAPQAE